MIDYKIVKYCKQCKTRFIVKKGQNYKFYCDDCQKKVDAYNQREADREEAEEAEEKAAKKAQA